MAPIATAKSRLNPTTALWTTITDKPVGVRAGITDVRQQCSFARHFLEAPLRPRPAERGWCVGTGACEPGGSASGRARGGCGGRPVSALRDILQALGVEKYVLKAGPSLNVCQNLGAPEICELNAGPPPKAKAGQRPL